MWWKQASIFNSPVVKEWFIYSWYFKKMTWKNIFKNSFESNDTHIYSGFNVQKHMKEKWLHFEGIDIKNMLSFSLMYNLWI